MSWTPPSSPQVPPVVDPNAAYFAAQQAQLIQQQVQQQVGRLEIEYKVKLDFEIEKLTKSLKTSAMHEVRSISIAVVSSIVAAFAVLVYVQTRSLNEGVIGFQNAVMSLQKEVLATASNLGEKASLVAAANKDLEASNRELTVARKKLEETEGRLQAVTQQLSSSKAEYELRLKMLPIQSPTGPK